MSELFLDGGGDPDFNDIDSFLRAHFGARAVYESKLNLPFFGLLDALEDMVNQFAYWSDSAGGLTAGGLSALEDAFEALGWDDPHPVPERRCDEPGCMRDGTIGWPTRPGGTGLNGGYRRTCHEHYKKEH